jgi:DNA-binding IclR family transcriptional regulator
MMHGMTALMTEPVAAALIVIDEARGASLTQVARATRRSPSTIQRALDRLLDAGLVVREETSGRLKIAQNVPHRAVRELAEWQLGDAQCQSLVRRVHVDLPAMWPNVRRRSIRSGSGQPGARR